MKKVFLVSFDGIGVFNNHQIIGFLSSNDRELIANFIKNWYQLTLQDLLPNKLFCLNSYHQEYTTDNPHINIHVDICYNLDENEDE